MTQFDERTEIMNGSKRDIWKLFHEDQYTVQLEGVDYG